jgi:uncharacterized damage-inducible protein DinB
MDIIRLFINQLEQNILIYEDLLADIPKESMKVRRMAEKWSIHEHACHMAEVEHLMYDRFLTFKNVEYPVFQPFLQEKARPDIHLLEMDFKKAIRHFKQERTRTVQLVRGFDENDWKKEATHPEYKEYNAKILLRHLLMHDNFHMYRMEELWLTRDPYLKQS